MYSKIPPLTVCDPITESWICCTLLGSISKTSSEVVYESAILFTNVFYVCVCDIETFAVVTPIAVALQQQRLS